MKSNALRLLGLHLAGNALLLYLGYAWLGVGESDAGQLLWSFVLLLLVVSGALWIHGSALVFFRQSDRSVARACALAARHLPALLALALIAACLYGLAAWLRGRFDHTAFVIASYVTLKTRKPLAPEQVLHGYNFVLSLFRWLIFPALLLPLATDVAQNGWSGFRLKRGLSLRWALRCIAICVLLLLAFSVPLKLMSWIPAFSQFWVQMASLMARMGAGYLLLVGALLGIEFLTSSGRPVRSHPVTVVSP